MNQNGAYSRDVSAHSDFRTILITLASLLNNPSDLNEDEGGRAGNERIMGGNIELGGKGGVEHMGEGVDDFGAVL